jgi:hypothetical protein
MPLAFSIFVRLLFFYGVDFAAGQQFTQITSGQLPLGRCILYATKEGNWEHKVRRHATRLHAAGGLTLSLPPITLS